MEYKRHLFMGYGNSTASLIQEDANPSIIDLSTLSDLRNAMTDEFLAMYQYFAEVRILENTNIKPYLIKELKQHGMEEFKHAGMLADRIMELGGKIITNPADLFSSKTSDCGYTEPTNPDSYQIIMDALNGEQCAIKSYTVMATNALQRGDVATSDMLQYIIQDEITHSNDLQQLINEYRLSPSLLSKVR